MSTYLERFRTAGPRVVSIHGGVQGGIGGGPKSSATRTIRCWSAVRSGAPVSMPGMMDTVPNVGLNDHSVQGLAWVSGSGHFA